MDQLVGMSTPVDERLVRSAGARVFITDIDLHDHDDDITEELIDRISVENSLFPVSKDFVNEG